MGDSGKGNCDDLTGTCLRERLEGLGKSCCCYQYNNMSFAPEHLALGDLLSHIESLESCGKI